MVHKLRCFIRGYVRVKLTGDEIFRLFNMCKSHAITLRNIVQEEQKIHCDILISDFFLMLPLLKKTKTRMKIVKKVGVPFWIQKGRRRLCFFISLFACLFMLNAVDRYVWAIEYIGNLQISNDELKDFISEENIHYGMKKDELQLEELEKRLRAQFPLVTWTSIYLEGTKLCVEVKENDVAKYDKDNQSGGSNLVATEAGTVTSIITRNGVPKVKAGDWVEEGQILVEGLVPVYDEALTVVDYQVYHADADVYLNTIMPYADEVIKRYSVMEYTGKVQNCFFVEVAGRRYEFPGFWKSFKEYEKISQKWQVSILEDIYLPMFYGNVIYKEYQLCYLEHTQNEMEMLLHENFQHFMETLEGKGVQIIEKNVKISNNTDSMVMKGELLVNRKTGSREELDSLHIELLQDAAKDTIEGAQGAQEE